MENFFHDIFQINFCDSLEVKEDLFREEELGTVIKELKKEVSATDCGVKEFLKYGVSKVRTTFLNIINMIFEKEGST